MKTGHQVEEANPVLYAGEMAVTAVTTVNLSIVFILLV